MSRDDQVAYRFVVWAGDGRRSAQWRVWTGSRNNAPSVGPAAPPATSPPSPLSREPRWGLPEDFPPVAVSRHSLMQTVGVSGEAYFAEQRSQFHAGLLLGGTLSVDAGGVASNADRSSPLSRNLAAHIATALKVETEGERAAGQTSGGKFEEACATFLETAFDQLGHLRPGEWSVHKLPGRGAASGVARYEQ